MEDVHSIPDLPTPEKERVPDEIADLQLTPVNGKRSEDVDEQTERVYKCLHLRCDATFKTVDKKVAHGKDWKKPSLKKAHSGSSYRSFADQGFEPHEYG